MFCAIFFKFRAKLLCIENDLELRHFEIGMFLDVLGRFGTSLNVFGRFGTFLDVSGRFWTFWDILRRFAVICCDRQANFGLDWAKFKHVQSMMQ